jgi:hypothetical protein
MTHTTDAIETPILPEPSQAEQVHAAYETRFRTNTYFLEDQLHYSQAVQDFKSVKHFLQRSAAFLSPPFNYQLASTKVSVPPLS